MTLETFTEAVDSGTVDQIQNTRQNRFVHILLLREVTAPARFTTDGETVNTLKAQTGDPQKVTRLTRLVDLFYRKQPGAERRQAKSIQRDLLSHIESCNDDRMSPNEMQQNSVESVLFGSAAGDEGISQRSRVYYNSAYSLRSAMTAVQQNTQNAPGDDTRIDAEEGQGTWTPDFVKPGTLFPSVVTLDSTTPEEVLFVMATLARTTRYGAGESRGGNIKNHLLKIYTGQQDGPANLEITRLATSNLADEVASADDAEAALQEIVTGDPIAIDDAETAVQQAYETLQDRRNLQFEVINDGLVEQTMATLSDDDTLSEVLETQAEKVQNYVTRFNDDD